MCWVDCLLISVLGVQVSRAVMSALVRRLICAEGKLELIYWTNPLRQQCLLNTKRERERERKKKDKYASPN